MRVGEGVQGGRGCACALPGTVLRCNSRVFNNGVHRVSFTRSFCTEGSVGVYSTDPTERLGEAVSFSVFTMSLHLNSVKHDV